MVTILLAKILGLFFLGIGLALFFTPDRFKNVYRQIVDDQNFLLLGGILAIWIGAVIVGVHNVWVYGWPVIITILGWWSIVKGYLLLAFPRSMEYFIEARSNAFFRLVGLSYIVLGLFLLYEGFSN